jgi:transcriptional regulator with XRE-family HTH domain
MTEIAQLIELNLAEKLQNREYRQRFFLAEASASIAKQLIALRKLRGLDQAQLAKLVDTQQPAISRIEKADYQNWSFNTLRKIAAAENARIRVIIEPAEDVLKEYETQSESVPVATCNYDALLDSLGGQSASCRGQAIPVGTTYTIYEDDNKPDIIFDAALGSAGFLMENVGRYSLPSSRYRSTTKPFSYSNDEKDLEIANLKAELEQVKKENEELKADTEKASPALLDWQVWKTTQTRAAMGIPTP